MENISPWSSWTFFLQMTSIIKRLRRKQSYSNVETNEINHLLSNIDEEEVTDKELKLARRIWNYMSCNHEMQKVIISHPG